MEGVFGAGVVTHLEEIDFYKNIEAVYGSSAGALIGAYFLSHQTKLGSSMFHEDLTQKFASIPNFHKGIWDRVKDHFFLFCPKRKNAQRGKYRLFV